MVTPTQSFTSAVSAYTKAAKTGVVEKSSVKEPQEGGFADLLMNAAKAASSTQQLGESQTIGAIKDTTDLSSVVTAVAEAELTLQTVVAIRDKVIAAYKEILRMPL